MENTDVVSLAVDAIIPASIRHLVATRQGITAIEAKVKEMQQPGWEKSFPVKHTFVSGVYAREMTLEAGAMVIGKIHREGCINVITRGRVSVITTEGEVMHTAPATFISPSGVKRVVFVHDETVWTTFHATEKTDPEEVEKEITFLTYEEYDDYVAKKLEAPK